MALLALFGVVGNAPAAPDYSQPKVLTGKVHARGSTNVLFLTKRSATTEGQTVHVLCEYTTPSGKVAARERCTFTGGKLTAFSLEELQTGSTGNTSLRPDPNNPRKHKLAFDYTPAPGASRKTDSETAEGDVLVGDMIPYFLVAHWDKLMRGEAAPFRFIAQDRLETVGFKLVKDGEQTWQGKPVVRLRMEATSFIIAALVDPLFFLVERDGAHRILQYDGRTTPLIKRGNTWKDLDAVTVYDWD